MGVHYLASSVSDQNTINNVNTDVNDNDDSQSFETPGKNNHSFTYLVLKRIQTTTPDTLKDHICFYQHNKSKISNLSNIPPPVKDYICFWMKWNFFWAAQYVELRALTKVIDTPFEIESFK